ncbi:MAG: hypothetical protein ACI379_10765 [Nocardioides sp.]|uniref:hypothetical protein n=1 Tax=Nocardioides sp. TaxID=35761 RepID=UPI003F071CEA
MNRDLNTFESDLLTELRGVVATRALDAPAPAAQRGREQRRRGRRWAAGGGLVGASAAALAGVAVLGPTPAFSVTEGNSGTITVKVNRLEGAGRLEDALAEYGVRADITYLEPERECAPGRYESRETPGVTLSVSSEEFTVELPPGSVADGETFVLSAAVRPNADGGSTSSVDFGVATGAVGPCEIRETDWSWAE